MNGLFSLRGYIYITSKMEVLMIGYNESAWRKRSGKINGDCYIIHKINYTAGYHTVNQIYTSWG